LLQDLLNLDKNVTRNLIESLSALKSRLVMRKYVKNHGIIFGGPQNFVGSSTGPWTGKG
jgi:hypothetical protein